jgi:hypothetical protein
MNWKFHRLAIAFVVFAVGAGSFASGPTTRPAGLAAEYPGDAGIDKHPGVLLHEDFESGTIDRKKWTSVTDKPGVVKLTRKTLEVHRGVYSLELSATMGKDTGGNLFSLFEKPHEQLYTRFYVKFAEDIDWIHHFVRMGANNPDRPWPMGRAGQKPPGDRRFTVAIEPWGRWGRYPVPGGWHFYCYWWKMPRSKDGKFWGQDFSDKNAYAIPQRGKWYCIEFMAKCNTPAKDDGEVAFWIDGKQFAHHKKINWRSSEKLKLNSLCVMLYVTDRSAKNSPPGKVNRVWFDDIVTATEYIGPCVPALPPKAKTKKPSEKPPPGNPTYRLKQRARGVLDQYQRKSIPEE